jgi:putative flippase GtrA
MNTFIRWGKFNLVGAMGMVVQLTALALFNRWMAGHYLWASAAAIELTLLHNFTWHLHYTWRDRRDGASWPRQLVRFHLSNGLVSMLGNLVLMRLLVHEAHLPLLISNVIAILCCSLANFCLGDNWAFAEPRQAGAVLKSEVPRPAHAVKLVLLLSLMGGVTVHAQTQSGSSQPHSDSEDWGADCAYESIFAGPAVSTPGSTQSTFTAGVTIGQYFAKTLGKGITASPQFELGIVGPLPRGFPLDGLVSMDFMFANKIPHRDVYAFLNGGYTRMFVTGNAVNFGLGVDIGKNGTEKAVRIELRDYYLFTGPRQHVVGLRMGFGKFIAD